MSNADETKKLLIKKLKTISDDNDFLLSIINSARSIDKRRSYYRYFRNGYKDK